MSIMRLTLAVVLLAVPSSSSRLSLRQENQTSLQVNFLKTFGSECDCKFSGECSCQGSMDFMRCISSACTKMAGLDNACDCKEDQFAHACAAMQDACPSAGLVCATDKAVCTSDTVPAPTDPNRFKEVQEPKEKRAEKKPPADIVEEVEEIADVAVKSPADWGMIPIITWIVLIAVTLLCYYLFAGLLKKKRPVITAILLIIWSAVLAATFFRTFGTHNWTFLQCCYYAVTTLTTVGYGDFVPVKGGGMIACVFFIWFTVGVLSVAISIVTAATEGAEEPHSKKKMLMFDLAGMGVFIAIGTIVFPYIEGWSHFDGLFFSVVTLSTVGYGHNEVNTEAGYVAAIIFMLLGVPMFGSMMGSLAGVIDDATTASKAKMSKPVLAGACVGIILGWLLLGGTGVHMLNSHGWTWTECIYFAAITMTTVGYGDYTPYKTVGDKVLTMVFIAGSVAVIGSVFGDLNSIVIDTLTFGMKKGQALGMQCIILGTIVVGGAAAFAHIEDWTFLRGIFFTSVTCTTVGYGHSVPSPGVGHIFATFFVLMTVPMTGALVGNIGSQYQDRIQKFFGLA